MEILNYKRIAAVKESIIGVEIEDSKEERGRIFVVEGSCFSIMCKQLGEVVDKYNNTMNTPIGREMCIREYMAVLILNIVNYIPKTALMSTLKKKYTTKDIIESAGNSLCNMGIMVAKTKLSNAKVQFEENGYNIDHVRSIMQTCGSVFNEQVICSDTSRIKNNEDLEQLGDSLLNAATLQWIVDKFPDMNESNRSVLKQLLTSTTELAPRAREMFLHKLLVGGHKGATAHEDLLEATVGAIDIFHKHALTRLPVAFEAYGVSRAVDNPLHLALRNKDLIANFVRLMLDSLNITEDMGNMPDKTFLSQLVRHYAKGNEKFITSEPSKVGEYYYITVFVPHNIIKAISDDYEQDIEPVQAILNCTYKLLSDIDGSDVPKRLYAYIVKELAKCSITMVEFAKKRLMEWLENTDIRRRKEIINMVDNHQLTISIKRIHNVYEATFNTRYSKLIATSLDALIDLILELK
jgi:hypothetical protein